MDRGLTHREAVFLIYVVGAILGLVAIYVMHTKPGEAYQIMGVLVLLGLWFHWDFEWRKIRNRD